jgi:hypothetical protein
MLFSIDIPEIFYSSMDKKPMAKCAVCGSPLLTGKDFYLIEKAFKKNIITQKDELIFEYAMCGPCQHNTSKELSKESLSNIKMYFDLYVDFQKRQEEFYKSGNFKLSDYLNECIITKKPVHEFDEYQLGGYFFGNQLMLDNLPFAIGGKAIEELQEVISKKTRDFLDGFKDRILPVDIRDKVPDDFLILI